MDTIGVSQTDFLSGEISMTFDLEKARDAAKFDDHMAITMFPLAIAEIERLRAEISEQKGMIWKTQQVKKEQAAQIKELEDALVEGLTNFLHYRASCYDPARRCPYAKECDDCSTWDACGHVEKFRSEARQRLQAEGKIGPDADAKPREGLYGKYCISKADGSPVDPNADYFVLRLDTDPVARRAAREYSYVTPDRDLARGLQDRLAKYDPQLKDCMNIQFFGLEKPHCWQITDERKAAIDRGMRFLAWSNAKTNDPGTEIDLAVLRAMLAEADHDKP